MNKGPDSDLQELIDKIKEKLEPFSMDDMKAIMDDAKLNEEE